MNHDELKDELERVQRQAAAMREALDRSYVQMKSLRHSFESNATYNAWLDALEATKSALNHDAGRDFISREQVKPLVDGLKEFLSWLESEGFKTKPADDALEHARKLGL